MKQIGTLSKSVSERLFSSSPIISDSFQLLLEELAAILDIKSFSNKAKVKAVTTRDGIYVTITEERTNANIIEEECPGEDLLFAIASEEISELSLSTIREFQDFKGNFVLPSTVKSHSCPKNEPCPICGDGKCTECHGEKTVKCDACEGDTICHSCNGSGVYPCHSCNESGRCRHCDGSGEEACDDCDGDGWVWEDCRACNGTGRYILRNGYDVECRACHGSGRHKVDCWTCNGTGFVECHVCNGSGKCNKCDGVGHVECRACHGSGTCGKCHGTGSLKCRNCNGTGLCPSCKGRQTIPCRRCLGTGVYQTFKCIALSPDNRTYVLKSKLLEDQLDINLQSIEKYQKYKGVPYVLDFDHQIIDDTFMIDLLTQVPDSSYLDKILEYRKSLIDSDGSRLISSDVYIKSSILVEQFPIIECNIEYSNEIFNFHIIGFDGKVFADKTPSFWDRLCAFFH